mmetsp:Transcript_20133/g.77071  ORF Transcript_20133/g.77071 Transcript_20133/m.77071 type:complete len:272 (+) Transcript_20133:103-918(+)
MSGVIQAGLLNPWDRALYLSVKDSTRFLNPSNWKAPYHGFSQAVVGRAISGGLYYVLQSRMVALVEDTFGRELNERTMNFMVGMGAGVCNGAVLSPLAAVKYHSWGKERARFMGTARAMARNGGVRPFFKAVGATASRDMVFGCVYEVGRVAIRRIGTRRLEDSDHDSRVESVAVVANMTAAALATGLSAPFNYARNMKLATKAMNTPPTTKGALVDLWAAAKCQPTLFERLSFLQQRLRVGWGTARVAVGMALGQLLFDKSRIILTSVAS